LYFREWPSQTRFRSAGSAAPGRARLEIRLKAFEVLNRVQFVASDTNVGDVTFDQMIRLRHK